MLKIDTTITPPVPGWIFLLVIFWIVFVGYADAANHNNNPESTLSFTGDAKISDLCQTLNTQQSEKARLLKQSDQLAEKIMQEKQKSQGISNRKLDSLLRESQQLVSGLESVSRQIEEIERELKQEYATAITTLVNQLEKESQDKKKKSLIEHLLKYFKEYEGLMKPATPLQIHEVNLEIQENDTPIDIRKKADFLSDQAALLKAKVLQIDAEVARFEKEKALREKVKKFADEINFFDNTLFVEERKVTQSGPESHTINPDDQGPPMLGDGILSRETPPSSIVQSGIPESAPSDMLFTGDSLDTQIEHLKQQKLRLGDQAGRLLEKIQIFYKRAEEHDSLKSQ